MKFYENRATILSQLANPMPELNEDTDQWQDAIVDALASLDPKEQSLSRLAEHYDISREELEDHLLSRSAVLLCHLTTFSQPATKADFHALVKLQYTRLGQLVGRLEKQVSQLDEAILQAGLVQEESFKALLKFRDHCASASGKSVA